MTTSEFPRVVVEALQDAAKQLGDCLDRLDFPNAARDAPFTEANLIWTLASQLSHRSPAFACYAEAACGPSGHTDLIAFDGSLALAIEAKTFGDVPAKAQEIERDFTRLLQFSPHLSRRVGSSERNWWNEAQQRWALIVVGNLVGAEISKAWCAKSREASDALLQEAIDKAVSTGQAGRIKSRQAPMAELVSSVLSETTRGAARVLPGGIWADSDDIWLLWAARRLDAA